MRKQFTLTVTCESAIQLEAALRFAADAVNDDHHRFNTMDVDDADEQLCDPDDIESTLARID